MRFGEASQNARFCKNFPGVQASGVLPGAALVDGRKCTNSPQRQPMMADRRGRIRNDDMTLPDGEELLFLTTT
jgi:hypothetical protein